MREIAAGLTGLLAGREPFALATVVGVAGSTPRPVGTAMAVDAAGAVVGSLSGGCVEGAVYETAREVLATGRATVSSYGISDDQAFEVGLTCGGRLDVLVQRIEPGAPALSAVLASLAAGDPVALATVAAGPAPLGTQLAVTPSAVVGGLGTPDLAAAVTDDARGLLADGRDGVRHYGADGGRQADADGGRQADAVAVLVSSFSPPARMLVFGAVDFAAAVSRAGGFLGYRVTICDARPVFARPERFPDAAEVVCAWPHRYLARTRVDGRTVICVLTHDPKFDVPLLELALRSPAGYVGAMGSRRTHADRLDRLRERGLDRAALSRLHSPIGLDLGARTPAETAVSIAAEIVAAGRGGSGRRLRDTGGAIHRPGWAGAGISGPAPGRRAG